MGSAISNVALPDRVVRFDLNTEAGLSVPLLLFPEALPTGSLLDYYAAVAVISRFYQVPGSSWAVRSHLDNLVQMELLLRRSERLVTIYWAVLMLQWEVK